MENTCKCIHSDRRYRVLDILISRFYANRLTGHLRQDTKLKAERCLFDVVRASPIDTFRVEAIDTLVITSPPPLPLESPESGTYNNHHAILYKRNPGHRTGLDHRRDRTHYPAQGSFTRMLPRSPAP
jgi:hypothetical protein